MIVINNLFVLDSAYASDWPFGRLQHCPGKSNFCDRRFCPILDNRAKWLAHVQLSKWPILFWTCRSVKQILQNLSAYRHQFMNIVNCCIKILLSRKFIVCNSSTINPTLDR